MTAHHGSNWKLCRLRLQCLVLERVWGHGEKWLGFRHFRRWNPDKQRQRQFRQFYRFWRLDGPRRDSGCQYQLGKWHRWHNFDGLPIVRTCSGQHVHGAGPGVR
ncbi:MAG TPA: hypothetical protein VFU02_20195, partial [Polyangiaceae bacterium]|nr:hypothetical protein [Polyangiaceae bacterium]